MAHDVEEACHHLILRHGESKGVVEYRELRVGVRAEYLANLHADGAVGDDASDVHLRACAHHCQHGAHGNHAARCLLLLHIVLLPRIFVAPCRAA